MRKNIGFVNDTGGTAAIMIALCLFVMLGVASLAIDIGQLCAVRNELQNVADAAALGGVAQLIQNQDGKAVRNSTQAIQSALQVAQTQSQLQGLPSVADEDRNDLKMTFGFWDIYAPSRQQAWTEIGSTCPTDSNANALRVSIKRASGFAFGPVTNLFAVALGIPQSQVSATATAYLGFTGAAEQWHGDHSPGHSPNGVGGDEDRAFQLVGSALCSPGGPGHPAQLYLPGFGK